MKGYSIKFMAEHFQKHDVTIREAIKTAGYNYIFKEKKEEFFSKEAFNYLKNKYKPLVEVIEVPVYHNVYWEVIHSKMNFE